LFHDSPPADDEIWQRIAVLEADVAHLKGGAVSKTVVDQVLSYLTGQQLSGSPGRHQPDKGDIARLLTESIGLSKTSLP